MSKFLDLVIQIKPDADAQRLANFVKDGFRLESWQALRLAGTVYDARIFALAHPDHPAGVEPILYSTIILSTTYEGPPEPYQQIFWETLTPFFLLVAFASKDPPFSATDLSAAQRAAFAACVAVIANAEAATTSEQHDAAQKAFRETTAALALALAQDELAVTAGTLSKTKFQLFTEWVNRNDRSFNAGSPLGANGETPGQDFRIPPSGRSRSQFINPGLPRTPWAGQQSP